MARKRRQPQPLPSPRPRHARRRPAPAAAARNRTYITNYSQPRPQASTALGGTRSGANYQGIILAEFIGAVLLVAATPIATKKDQTGISPYEGSDMIKLGSITIVYFLLALLSAGGSGAGRFGAWFGGLILLVVGLGEATSIAKVLDVFGGAGNPSSSAPPAPTTTGGQVG